MESPARRTLPNPQPAMTYVPGPLGEILSGDDRQAAARRCRNRLSVGDDCVLERLPALAGAFLRQRANRPAHDVLGVLGVAVEIRQDVGDRDRAVLRMPAVV